MTEIAEVVSSQGNRVRLRLVQSEHCRSCAAARGCHANMDLGLSAERRLEAQTRLKTRPGDRVEITIPENRRLAAGLVVFALPILLGVAGAVFGSLLGNGNLATGIGAGSGLGLGILAAVVINRAMGRNPAQLPEVTRVVEPAASACHERS